MDRFYKLGQLAALEKLGQGGILRQLGTAAKGAYQGLSPEAAHALRRMGIGAGVGAGVGGVTDDFSLRGMLGGAAIGAGAGLGHSKLYQHFKQQPVRQALGRPLASEGRQLGLFG